jgi:Cytochrome c biogenesis factor
LQKSGDEEGAIKEYTKGIEINSGLWQAYVERAEIYEKRGNYDLALADYTTLILRNPKSAAWHRGRAEIYYRMGNMKLAAEGFEKTLELIGKDAKSEYFLGEIYETHYKDKEKALVYYRLTVENNANTVVQKEVRKKALEAIQRLEEQ